MKVTVITPLYGHDHRAREAFRKLLLSMIRERPSEWIVVYDDTALWIETEKVPGFMKLVRSPDVRQAHKKNIALNMAQGDIIVFIDADQEAEKGLLSEIRQLFERGADVVIIPERFGSPRSYFELCYFTIRELYWLLVEGIPRAFRKELVEDIRFRPSLHYAEDIEFWRELRNRYRDIKVFKTRRFLIHNETFSFTKMMRKIIASSRAKKAMRYREGKKTFVRQRFVYLLVKKIAEEPWLIPGVVLLLLMRSILRRVILRIS
ncbi:MAG: hypothetical protein DRN15_07870 [Thermoprotei archaeon]|nr:MAG: hypothetical protein DRM97_06630 [Thermoprotei archaeon]RLF22854.1 MAG: hypothetical protein DRN15_07870 [Thermoprotei archaeon]